LIASPEIDAVVIASWDGTHADLAVKCIEAGKPVFCEKPLATTLEDAKKVVEAEKASGKRLLQIGFMRRFDPDYIKMKKILDSGELGAPLMAHCISRTRSHPKNHTTEQHITNIAIHEIDICRWLLGENLNEVAVRFPRATCFAEGTCQDPQLVLMQSDSGVLIDVEVSGNSYYGYEILCELVCEKGTIRLPVAAEPIVRSYLQCGQAIPEDWTNRFVVAYQEELQHWVDYLQGKTDVPGPGAEDGYEACKISDALIKAQTTGQWEKVEA
ncbi:MAG: Gfo/Idh/MocA family oxidoreductase, partial [Butyricicoccus sp.]